MSILDREKPEELIIAWIGDLEPNFLKYKARLTDWSKELARDEDGEDVISNRTSTVPGKETAARRAKSQFRSNFIPVNNNHLVARLVRSEPRIRISELNDLRRSEKSIRTQRLLHGLLRSWDRQQQREGQVASWLLAVANDLALGKVIAAPQVVKVNGQYTVRCPLYSPLEVIHDFRNFPRLYVTARETSLARILTWFGSLGKQDYKIPAQLPRWVNELVEQGDYRKMVTHLDIWIEEEDREENIVWHAAAIRNNASVGSTPLVSFRPEELVFLRKAKEKHLPHIITTVNVPPQDRNMGRPWFWPIVDHIQYLNLGRSLMVDGLELLIRPPITTSPGDDGVVWTIPTGQLGAGTQIPLTRGRIIDFMKTQDSALEAEGTLLQGIRQELDQLMPPELRGQVPGANTSGYLFNQISDLVGNAIFQFDAGIDGFLESVFGEVLHQVQETEDFSIDVSAAEASGERMGLDFYETFTRRQLAQNPVVSVKLATSLPKDDLRTVQIFREAVTSGMLDEDTARVVIANLENPGEVRRLIQLGKIANSPEAQTTMLLNWMRGELQDLQDRANAEIDGRLKRSLMRDAFIMEGQLAAFESRLIGQAQQQLQRQPPGGGISPEAQPPEAAGPALSPDVQGGINGTPPARSTGRPTEVEG